MSFETVLNGFATQVAELQDAVGFRGGEGRAVDGQGSGYFVC